VKAGEMGTIITKSGEKYENVIIKVHRTLDIILAEKDTVKYYFNFGEIDRIYDADGIDRTADTAKWHSIGFVGTWTPESDWIQIRPSEQFWKIGIRGAANFGLPISRDHAGLTSGFGYEGTIHFPIINGFAVRFSFSKLGPKGTQDILTETYSREFQFSATRYRAGIQYFRRPAKMTPGKMIPYLYAEFGIISSKTISQTYIYENDQNQYWEYTHKEKKFTTNQGGGIIVLISKKIGFDFGAEYNFVFGDESGVDYGNILDFKLGLTTLF
jgi:hypothetical protein